MTTIALPMKVMNLVKYKRKKKVSDEVRAEKGGHEVKARTGSRESSLILEIETILPKSSIGKQKDVLDLNQKGREDLADY